VSDNPELGAKPFDFERARKLLEEAAKARKYAPIANDDPWLTRIDTATRRWETSGGKTYVAALGISILARATDANADLNRIAQDKGSASRYHARGLADAVGKVAPLLHIDLGTSSPNPLNNSPFRGPKTLQQAREQTHKKNLAMFDDLCAMIDDVAKMTSHDAALVLQAFVQARTRSPSGAVGAVPDVSAVAFVPMMTEIQRWVRENGEGGRRAQAVAAGILDAAYGTDRVITKAVNDPDREFPGDIGVKNHTSLRFVVEVRDKNVPLAHLLTAIDKVAAHGIGRLTVLAVGKDQQPLATTTLQERAGKSGLFVRVFFDWHLFATDAVFNGTNGHVAIIERIPTRVLARAEEVGVSAKGLTQLRDALLSVSNYG
jgi:hypothetical protein